MPVWWSMPLVLQPGQGVPGDEAAHAEAADDQRLVAQALGDGAQDRLAREAGVLEDGGAAVAPAEDDHVPAAPAQLAEEGVRAALEAVVEPVERAVTGVEAVGQQDGADQAAVALAVVDPGGRLVDRVAVGVLLQDLSEGARSRRGRARPAGRPRPGGASGPRCRRPAPTARRSARSKGSPLRATGPCDRFARLCGDRSARSCAASAALIPLRSPVHRIGGKRGTRVWPYAPGAEAVRAPAPMGRALAATSRPGTPAPPSLWDHGPRTPPTGGRARGRGGARPWAAAAARGTAAAGRGTVAAPAPSRRAPWPAPWPRPSTRPDDDGALDTGASLLAAADPDAAGRELLRRGEEYVRRAWERGWLPADLDREARRRSSTPPRRTVLAELTAAELARYGNGLAPPGGASSPPCAAPAWAGTGGRTGSRRATAVLQALRLLLRLPAIEPLGPPPGSRPADRPPHTAYRRAGPEDPACSPGSAPCSPRRRRPATRRRPRR